MEVYRGEKRSENFTITDPSGSTIDISSADVHFEVSHRLPADSKVIDVEAQNESVDGTCEVILNETDTNIEPKLYFYEVWVNFADGSDYSAEVGRFFVRKRVNK